MLEILRKYLMIGGKTPATPSLEELCFALSHPQSATPELRAYINTHPDLVDDLRALGLVAQSPDTDDTNADE